MKKIKIEGSYILLAVVLSIFTWFMGSMIPVRTWCSKPKPRKNMVFRCEMVDGKVRDYTLNLPEDVNWYVGTSRGSYYVQFQSPGINLFGKKAWVEDNEGCINGVLVCNRIK
jgi:hypothetical protein|nr:MAG TPA: hypothetical protein [Caudoviricetes sp.]